MPFLRSPPVHRYAFRPICVYDSLQKSLHSLQVNATSEEDGIDVGEDEDDEEEEEEDDEEELAAIMNRLIDDRVDNMGEEQRQALVQECRGILRSVGESVASSGSAAPLSKARKAGAERALASLKAAASKKKKAKQ